jgi:hypothetical protein
MTKFDPMQDPEQLAHFILYSTYNREDRKQYVLDQLVRYLLKDKYDAVMKDYKKNNPWWNNGTAPTES